jgi:uncharacterized membrane protein
MEKVKKSFNKRKIVALILLVTLIMMPISGAYIHATHGEATTHKWLHIHVLFGVIFIVAAIYHVIYNWRTFKHYLIGKNKN